MKVKDRSVPHLTVPSSLVTLMSVVLVRITFGHVNINVSMCYLHVRLVDDNNGFEALNTTIGDAHGGVESRR